MHQPHLDFALALHRRLPAAGNLPWSPYSVASALGIAAAGARGDTYDQLDAALAPGGALDELGRMLAGSADPREAEVAVANTLWMRAGWHFLDEYQRHVRDWPGGTVRSADFAGDPDGARVGINEDVARTTRGLVRDLLAEGAIHPDVVAVIVNALYLKVAWLNPFEEHRTVAAPFHAPSGTREVPTMRQQESFPYAEAGGWRMVTLPTAGDVVADVLLSDSGETVPSAEAVTALQRATRSVKVDLHLPKFRVEAASTLSDHLRHLGVIDAFDRDLADFSGITDEGPVWIENVIHKAVVRVDEQGFEGAAATAVVMRTISMDISEPVPFHVDRPFLLLVRHRRSGAIYFLARVVEP
jgi:serine protease inhibitor